MVIFWSKMSFSVQAWGESFWSQKACAFCGGVRILIYGNRFSNLKKNLESNWHWLKMGKNGHFMVKNEFQRPRLGGVFLVTKSVSLLWWGPDFDLWKSFQSRLLRPNGRLRRNNISPTIVIMKENVWPIAITRSVWNLKIFPAKPAVRPE